MSNEKTPSVALTRVVSLLGLLGLWIVVSWLGNDPSVLPYPWELLPVFAKDITSGELPYHLAQTLVRVAWAFVIAFGIGLPLGVWMGRNARVNAWLDPWLIFFLNLPALVLIVLAYLWIGLNEWAAIFAVALNKIPNMVTITREGARSFDRNLDDLAAIYSLPKARIWRHIYWPQMLPFVAAATRSGIAVIWKIVLVVEFLGRSNGVGFQIHLYFQVFNVPQVLVYSISFIAVMLAIEFLVLQPWERRVTKWRQT